MRIVDHRTYWAHQDKQQSLPFEGEHTVISAGQGPETRRGGGGGGDLADTEPTLPDQAIEDEEALFKGPQQENA